MPTARGREIASTGCRHHPDASPQTERYRKRRCPTADSKAHAIDTAFGHGRPPVCFLSRQLESYRGGPRPPFHLDAIPLSKCAKNCTLPLFARMAVYCTHGELALHANGSRTGAAGRERIANGRGWARTNRERAWLGANESRTNRERARLGAADRKLRFEVHESATFFTADNLPLLKKRLKPLLGGSFRNT